MISKKFLFIMIILLPLLPHCHWHYRDLEVKKIPSRKEVVLHPGYDGLIFSSSGSYWGLLINRTNRLISPWAIHAYRYSYLLAVLDRDMNPYGENPYNIHSNFDFKKRFSKDRLNRQVSSSIYPSEKGFVMVYPDENDIYLSEYSIKKKKVVRKKKILSLADDERFLAQYKYGKNLYIACTKAHHVYVYKFNYKNMKKSKVLIISAMQAKGVFRGANVFADHKGLYLLWLEDNCWHRSFYSKRNSCAACRYAFQAWNDKRSSIQKVIDLYSVDRLLRYEIYPMDRGLLVLVQKGNEYYAQVISANGMLDLPIKKIFFIERMGLRIDKVFCTESECFVRFRKNRKYYEHSLFKNSTRVIFPSENKIFCRGRDCYQWIRGRRFFKR